MHTRRHFLRRCASALPCLSLAGTRVWGAPLPTTPLPVLDTLAAGLPLTPRAEWAGSIEPRRQRMRLATGFDRITIHHSGASWADVGDHPNEAISRLDDILAGHMSRNYGDLAYHFVVDHLGRVWEGRSLRYEGAHVARHNTSNIGVMLPGNFETEKPTGPQLHGMKELVLRLRDYYTIPTTRLYGHRNLASSACPGRELYPYVRSIRRKAAT